jgi:hypothetical protein
VSPQRYAVRSVARSMKLREASVDPYQRGAW